MWEKIQRWGILLFSAVFALVWSVLLFLTAAGFRESKKICGEAAVCLALLLLCMIFLKRFGRTIWENEHFWQWSSIALLACMTAGMLYTGLQLRVYPGWDFGAVYQGAVELAEDGIFTEQSKWYFTTYPNNVAVCLFLALVFKFFGGLCSYITLGVLLNVFLMMAGMCFFFLLARHLYGIRYGFLGLLSCTLFLPFYMHAPIFYTDTFALPFVTGTFLLYQLRKKDVRYLAVTGLFLAAGYKMKGSLGVILIALLIHIWLQKGRIGDYVKQSVLLAVPFLLLTGFLTILPEQMSLWEKEDVQKNEFPLEHWLAMGLENNGGYSADVYWMTASVEGREEKIATDREFIREKLEEYGGTGLLQHLQRKAVFTWGDGVYFAPEKLKRDPLQENWLHAWFLYDGGNYAKTYRYCSAFQLLLLFGILLSAAGNFFRKGERREIHAMQLVVFGIFVFLLIWETRSRYLVNFVPIFVLLGIDGLQGVEEQGTRIVNRVRERHHGNN
ncbi:MAG: hypothetical protein HFH25_03005 [Lachnospiraceae bacterium]|nr:hypothetical protein [Lachnospiraceae bacterium]